MTIISTAPPRQEAAGATARASKRRSSPTMGYQPALDGLRALSVGIVLLYHGGFSWMHGGFFGVEVFFVVSGFLITSLLLEERSRDGSVSFAGFWTRRARRLLPALVAVLVSVALWGAIWGSHEQQAQLRRDIPWAVFYASNWGQILGDVPYFSGDPALLRHLWSLAVEEQWYLIWPVVFVGIMSLGLARKHLAIGLVATGVVVFAVMAWLQMRSPTMLGGPPSLFAGVDRTNFMYLATVTRAGGLLLGAGAAFVWRPWAWPRAGDAAAGRWLDPLGAGALAVIGCAAAAASITAGYVYSWLLALVSICSLVAVCVAVHPAAVGFRRILSWQPLVEMGKRSYGLYLWSWPIFVIAGAYHGEVRPFLVAMAVTVVVTEASYRYLETPIRKGALGRRWRGREQRWPPALIGAGVVVVALVVFYANVSPFNRFAGGDDVAFDAEGVALTGAGAATSANGDPATDAGNGAVGGVNGQAGAPGDVDGSSQGSGALAEAGTADSSRQGSGPGGVDSSSQAPGAPAQADGTNGGATGVAGSAGAPSAVDRSGGAPATTLTPLAAANLAIVGDSEANALAINLPDGIGVAFPNVDNGAVDGCSVYDSGEVRSSRNFSNNFAGCDGWQDEWARAAEGNDVALVVIGAWDVFDIVDDGTTYTFGTPEADAVFSANVRSGIDAMLATGANVGLLEVACMRPVDVKGAGVPALPERGDDTRVAHVNGLLRQVAGQYDARVAFVEGPDAWCADEAIATDLGYRWDGVHVYKPGANLIMEKITPQLLSLAAA